MTRIFATMSPALPYPEICSSLRIKRDTEVARGEFRKRRHLKPLADYLAAFPSSEAAAAAVIHALDSITTVPADREVMSGFVHHKAEFASLRSLAAPPISADDLNTLLGARVNRTSVSASQELTDSFAALLRASLDPKRFPWVRAGRAATTQELDAAKLATAVLTAVSVVQTERRSNERNDLEGRVAALLNAQGFIKAKNPVRGVELPSEFPRPGSYMKACKFGDHNADFVIALRGGRILAIECKASNSEVNGFKRLNKEVVGDAKDWITRFGTNVVVVGAALRGVFKANNVETAQEERVHLFWWHRMHALEQFLDKSK